MSVKSPSYLQQFCPRAWISGPQTCRTLEAVSVDSKGSPPHRFRECKGLTRAGCWGGGAVRSGRGGGIWVGAL